MHARRATNRAAGTTETDLRLRATGRGCPPPDKIGLHRVENPSHTTGALSLQGYLARSIRSVTMLGSGCYGAGSFHSYVKPLLMALCLWLAF